MNLCMLTDCPLSAEALKASQCPVPGAVVIAPLTQSVRNYGSLGGSFTVVGAPVLGANGATFDGVDDVAHLVIGSGSSAFTLVTRASLAPKATLANALLVMGGTVANPVNAGISLGTIDLSPQRYVSMWNGSAAQYSPCDSAAHTITIRSDGVSNVNIFIDGVNVVALARGALPTIKNGLTLGAWFAGGAYSLFCGCTIANAVLYHSALSAPNQAAVEAYVAAA